MKDANEVGKQETMRLFIRKPVSSKADTSNGFVNDKRQARQVLDASNNRL